MARDPRLQVVVLALLVVAAALLVLLPVRGESNEQPGVDAQLTAQSRGANRLYLAGRDEFRICIDSAGQAVLQGGEEQFVQHAMAGAFARLADVPTDYQDPRYDVGCPAPRVLGNGRIGYLERNTLRARSQIIGDPLGPTDASPYRVFVYFTDSDTYAESFGSEPYASTAEEFLCEGDFCGPITRAVYVPAGSVQQGVLANGLLETLYLLTGDQVERLLEQELSTPEDGDLTPGLAE